MVTPNAILDGDLSIGQVQCSVRYDLLGQDLSVIGQLNPLTVGSVSATTSGTIKRNLGGVKISQQDLLDVNPFIDMVLPWMVLGDGTEWPLGVFCFSSLPRRVLSYMDTMDATMLDQDFNLDVEAGRSWSIPTRGRILNLVTAILDEAYIPPSYRDLPNSDDTQVLGPVSWDAKTHLARIIDDCARLAGWLPHYFDNRGKFVLRTPPDVAYSAPDIEYQLVDGRILAGTIVENDNLLDAPNVFRVVGSSPVGGEIVGEAQVAPYLPYSVEKRGRRRPVQTEVQGLTSASQAQTMAQAQAASAPGFKAVEFDATPDPRHDLFMLVAYNQDVYRELGFNLTLNQGPHHHSLSLGGFPAAG